MPQSCRTSHARWLSVGAGVLLIAVLCAAHSRASEPPKTRDLNAERFTDEDGNLVIRVPARDGTIAKAELLAGLGLVAGLELHAVEWLLPDGVIDLQSPKIERRLAILNRAIGRYAKIQIERAARVDDGNAALLIEIDRGRLQADERRAKSKFRTVSLKILDPRGKLRAKSHYGLHIDEAAASQKPHELLVVGIHGFNAGVDAVDAFLNPLRDAGFTGASFAYPNDQPIADSAKLLSDELKALAKREPNRRVAIVAFSMGGLVARAAIEDQSLDPGNVERLIMIAPPNHGAVCARYARGFDLYEHVYREHRLEPRTLIAVSLLDGMGEARQDLCPDSPFLKRLNAHERNQNVRYSILLGEGGELDREVVHRISSSIDNLEHRSTLVRLIGPKLERFCDELEELTEPSDGLITVRRGRLDGVQDVEVLQFTHLAPFANREDHRVSALQSSIAKRLE